MKRLFSLALILAITIGLTSCVVSGTATVAFYNSGYNPTYFYLDGSMMTGSPYGHTTAVLGNEWIGISPGNHTLGASLTSTGPTTTESVNLPVNEVTTWYVDL
jgi:hypothetical protein